MWRNCRNCCRGSRRRRKKRSKGTEEEAMRAVVQRVSRAKATVEGRVSGEIGPGLMILLGVGKEDTSQVAAAMAEKVANLQIFEDEQGKMTRSLLDGKGNPRGA